jgi:hypothetical protein
MLARGKRFFADARRLGGPAEIQRPLVILAGAGKLRGVKGKLALPIALMVVFALTRVPGMLPQNFSAAYALVFCAGVYFPGRMAWWLPLATLLATDIGLNFYYWLALGIDVWAMPTVRYQLMNYLAFAVLIWLGRRFKPQSSLLSLLGGGVLGAILFYLITNTASWLFNPFGNPEYTKTLAGWLTALTKGTGGWPQTWEFFRNTLLSGGLFTGLFVGAMKVNEAVEEAREDAEEPEEAPAPAGEAQPEESKA